MRKLLTRLINHETLSKEEASNILTEITEQKYNDTQIAAFVTVFLMRGITVEELTGFRSALMNLCVQVDTEGMEAIDVCGTGGDGKNTFNISTISSFVVAGAGYKVVKHGNKSVSSNCGSSDVLQSLGYQFTNHQDQLLLQLDRTDWCYFHAPLFHPALKSVGPIRRDLGIKTFFNMLGPLVNPGNPSHQLVGVFNLKLMRLYSFIFEELGHKYVILHGLNGYDEVSLTDDTKIISSNSGTSIITPSKFGLPRYKQQDIYGGSTIEEAKKIFLSILENDCSQAHKDVVLANSALAIDCFKDISDIASSLEEARVSLESGKAFKTMQQAIELSNQK